MRAALARIGPMRSAEPGSWLRASLPIWSCSVWGLPCLRHYCRSGALLPHLFTLTTAWGSPLDQSIGYPRDALRKGAAAGAVCSLWHWPSTGLDARVPDVIRHTALRSSDFPLPATPACARTSGSDRPVLLPVSSVPRKAKSQRTNPFESAPSGEPSIA